MTGAEHLERALTAARESLELAERRRPRDVAGGSVDAQQRQVARMRARVEILEQRLADARFAQEHVQVIHVQIPPTGSTS